MKRHTDQELMDFVCRIDSLDKVQKAVNYINKYFDKFKEWNREAKDLYDELMNTVAFISRELYRQA